jgi:hypothetical protein
MVNCGERMHPRKGFMLNPVEDQSIVDESGEPISRSNHHDHQPQPQPQPLEKEDEFLERIADSLVIAFFAVAVIKIGQYAYENFV